MSLALETKVDGLIARVQELEDELAGRSHAPQLDMDHRHLDTSWLLSTSTIVFLMQLGFAMLEAGMCRQNNVSFAPAL